MRFVAFQVLLGTTLPVLLLYCIMWAINGSPPTGTEMVGRGELFLIGSGLLIGALQPLIASHRLVEDRWETAVSLFIAATVFMTAFAFGVWGALTAAAIFDKPPVAAWISTWVGVAYVLYAFLQAGFAVALEEKTNH